MDHVVIFTPEARQQLVALFRYIAVAASPATAERYTGNIVSYCESLATFPYRGRELNEVRPGLRVTHYKKRTVIAFDIDGRVITIIGIFYGGQNYEEALKK
ncbi:type II toxin-antitoxin system RelE/ParE family toxin [Actimicrobium sp. CCI2.3]|uniref:type II toxin-antitoxin system RelE/ParE family toxin n=1 Tax=Actimicrobium sp. CCI2.3 TaxID=3048616 RepID=UPI002AB3E34C|nr:type II toxin-antitoxin system RelE/ParE family toxin [Actimicrobium sp. CCI2.3]MDY7572810.1 type II toxin-antitoxin system RelE/ParE family toxin [Actimicrobium sp. CCI2.3]MEB0020655.1 type II toxin-antitoxin system RelE/ParE family toxin [Actimicrobium sp. CCI2.3]